MIRNITSNLNRVALNGVGAPPADLNKWQSGLIACSEKKRGYILPSYNRSGHSCSMPWRFLQLIVAVFVSLSSLLPAIGIEVVELQAVAASTHSVDNSVKTATSLGSSNYPWKRNITTTVFWIGEKATQGNNVPNDKSSWDINWVKNYGGTDTPRSTKAERERFTPTSNKEPQQNPFYVALPYNDVGSHGTKPEAGLVIPWFRTAFQSNGKSVCKGRWVAIRVGTKVCYAQWEDVGPFKTDHWQYVFGNERPLNNKNKNAGLDVSPATRDFFNLTQGTFVSDWRFVEFYEVPPGPWRMHGENNIFVSHKEMASKLHMAYLQNKDNMPK